LIGDTSNKIARHLMGHIHNKYPDRRFHIFRAILLTRFLQISGISHLENKVKKF
jgi:hypothetical protein